MTCVLSHKSGHYEETTLSGPPDASGSKNAIQAIGSTLTYLQRYSLVQALGLAAGDDDDGKAAGLGSSEPIDAQQVAALRKALSQPGQNETRFLRHFKIASLEDMPIAKFADAMETIAAEAAQRAKS